MTATIFYDLSKKLRGYALCVFLLGLFPLLSITAMAQRAGTPDTSFSGDGVAQITFADYNLGASVTGGVAIQSDNKIVLAGKVQRSSGKSAVSDFALARFNADGMIDENFGSGGKVTTHVRDFEEPGSIAVQPDGKILIGGYSTNGANDDFALIRYNANGSLDASFNQTGIVLATFDDPTFTIDFIEDIILQPDGKIIAVGGTSPFGAGSRYDFAAMRFNTDGSLDTSFNGTGKIKFSLDANHDWAHGVVLQPDGKIVIFGEILQNHTLGIARLNANGTFDNSFDQDGKVIILIPNSEFYPSEAALQIDNKFLITGNLISGGNNTDFAVIRVNNNGTLDSGFGSGGVSRTDFGVNDAANHVVIQPNGKIFAVGMAHGAPNNPDFGVARYNPDGSPDNSFGTNGKIARDLGNNFNDFGTSAAVQKDGKIVVAGTSGTNFAVARYAGNAITQPSAAFDYDDDGKADISVFRASAGDWYFSRSSDGAFYGTHFGASGDLITPADFDNDGKTDISVFRPSTGSWYRLNSSNNSFVSVQFGANGDLPTPGDFDGDGRADITVYRPSNGSWYRINSANNQFVGFQFGIAEDKPLIGDFDGDGKSDLTVFRPSNGTWYRINSGNNSFSAHQFGVNGDKPVPADYDGDGKTDLAVYRASSGHWYRTNSGNGSFSGTQFGIAEDKPAPADFDGDGRADLVVFRPSQGFWYLSRSSNGFTGTQFGTSSDVPTPNAFVR